ncbi:hypothetical protein [Argonema galeatum]|uniref:hypothetical protein n=1 Tax=Argonema galeatum TaxID=2942762 RepID=UPI002012CC58|nr:hypothetical protein [Argonema galeatum]MCL1463091.1 hypothetical protein [Argonema galeatum A003/A1]
MPALLIPPKLLSLLLDNRSPQRLSYDDRDRPREVRDRVRQWLKNREYRLQDAVTNAQELIEIQRCL